MYYTMACQVVNKIWSTGLPEMDYVSSKSVRTQSHSFYEIGTSLLQEVNLPQHSMKKQTQAFSSLAVVKPDIPMILF